MLQLSMGPSLATNLPCSLEICPFSGYKVPVAAVRFKGMQCSRQQMSMAQLFYPFTSVLSRLTAGLCCHHW